MQLQFRFFPNYLIMQLQFFFLPELILHKYSVEGYMTLRTRTCQSITGQHMEAARGLVLMELDKQHLDKHI